MVWERASAVLSLGTRHPEPEPHASHKLGMMYRFRSPEAWVAASHLVAGVSFGFRVTGLGTHACGC
jgi:hypothetical protein